MHISCTCGSQAALTICEVPLTVSALRMKFSVVVTEAYSSHIRAAWPLPVTRNTISCPDWPTSAPNARNTATCGSISRAPSVQPLTSCSSRASPRRTSRPGIIMIEARIACGSVALPFGAIVE